MGSGAGAGARCAERALGREVRRPAYAAAVPDTSWRTLFEAIADDAGMLVEAVKVVHGPTPVRDKLRWTVDVASAASGAAAAGFVVDGEEVLTGRTEDLAELLPAIGVLLRRTLVDGEVVRSGTLVGSPAGFCSYLAVPVPGARAMHGALVLADPRHDLFDGTTETIAVALAANVGVALDNVATTTELAQLELARRSVVHQLQEAVRPAVPEVAETELGVYYLPADPESPTGGDLYDWQLLPDGDLHLAVIDVVGKGVGATKDALALTHVLRVLVLQGCALGDLICQADALYGRHHPEVAATIIVARYSPATGVLRLAGGGHPPALVVREDGRTEFVEAPGMALGWPAAGSVRVSSVRLGRSDSVVLYTDGLVEARRDIDLGFADLEKAAVQTSRYPAVHQARALVDRALAGAARRDDTLALVIRRQLPPESPGGRRLAPLTHRFSPNPVAVGLARHLLADWLHLQDVEREEIETLELIASELCANAVTAATGAPTGVTLRAIARGSDAVLEVEDDAGTFAGVPELDDLPDATAESGRGLFLARALSHELDVEVEVGVRTVVRVTRHNVFPHTPS
ncbi:MAG: hypothetical protein NVS3B12_00990 [Acidimicrobiales bacterium]